MSPTSSGHHLKKSSAKRGNYEEFSDLSSMEQKIFAPAIKFENDSNGGYKIEMQDIYLTGGSIDLAETINKFD